VVSKSRGFAYWNILPQRLQLVLRPFGATHLHYDPYCTMLIYSILGETAPLNTASRSTVPCLLYSSTAVSYYLTTHLLRRLTNTCAVQSTRIFCVVTRIFILNNRYSFHPTRGLIRREIIRIKKRDGYLSIYAPVQTAKWVQDLFLAGRATEVWR
jgi:hypothetical protein